MRRGWMLVSLLAGLLSGYPNRAAAQVTTTTIQDTIYRADGTLAGGTVLVSWPRFTTAAGNAVAAGSTSTTIGPAGVLTLALTPNAGAMPTGSYYTAVLHLDDGTTSKEYWVIPVSATPVTLAAIESQVLPTSVAMQTVSKAYVDQAIAQATSGGTQEGSGTEYVPITGGTMTGPLGLPADPVSPNQAADKHYVDTNVTALTGGIAQKVSLVPNGTQTVAQPAGTQLQVNALNGELYASQFQSGDGGNGIANALTSPACGSGCLVNVDPSYASGETISTAQIPQAGHTVDQRGGADAETFFDPVNHPLSLSNGESLDQISTRSDANSPLTGAVGTTHVTLSLSNSAMAGGSNQLPGNVENPPYGKSTYSVTTEIGNYYTQGQHVQNTSSINCYGVGDCLAGSQFITSSGGYRDMADEGAHPFDLQLTEDLHVFQGTCSAGCTAGSTSVMVTATSGGGTQGDGRYLIDKNPADDLTTGAITSSGRDLFGKAGFSGTNFPVSVFLETAAAAKSQPKDLAPGTVTLPITTSGVPSGFATTTTGLPISGIACVADPIVSGQAFPDFETTNYTVVDASHLSLTLNKVHGSGAVVAIGGLCGYGLEQTVDTTGVIRQVFPVIGSISATSLYYAGAVTPIIGNDGLASTSGYQNVTLQVASIARQSNVVTVTLASSMPYDLNGLTLTVSGVADASYDGSFTVTTTGGQTLTYPDTGSDGTSSGGTVSLLTGGYVMYPMAEVLSVYDPATKQVDGLMTLAPNDVAWAQGDALEEPHYYQQSTFADTEYVTQYVPRPVQYSTAGKQYQGLVGPGVRGWEITNAVPKTEYLGDGGTHELPDDAYMANGPWKTDFEVDAGTLSLIRAHCNVNGCNRWDSGYSLFALDSANGEDFLFYNPSTDTASWNLRGQNYSFSPTAFTASTINATTVNATSVQATGGASEFIGTHSQFGPTLHLVPYAADYQVRLDFDSATGVTYTNACSQTETNRWQFAMDPDHSWVLYDTDGCRTVLTAEPDGNMTLMSQGGSLSVGATSLTGSLPGLFNVGTTSQFFVDGSGNVSTSGTITAKAAIESGTASNTDLAGTLTVAAGATSSASYAFAGHYTSAPVCMVQPQNAAPATAQALSGYVPQVSASLLSVSVGTAPSASVTFGYACVARN